MAPIEDILVNTSEPLRQPNPGCSAMAAAGEFLREYWLRFVTISAVVPDPHVILRKGEKILWGVHFSLDML